MVRIPGGAGGSPPKASSGGGFAASAMKKASLVTAGALAAKAATASAPTAHPLVMNPLWKASGVMQSQSPADVAQHLAPIAAQTTAQTPPLPVPPPAAPADSSGDGGGEQPPDQPQQDDQQQQVYDDPEAGAYDDASTAPVDDDPGMVINAIDDSGEPPADGEAQEDAAVDAPPSDDTADFVAAGEADEGIQWPLVASHVHDGQLRTLAFMKTANGVTPLTACAAIPGPRMNDGHVYFGYETPYIGLEVAKAHTRKILMTKAEKEKVKLQCESLVRRSRQGEQNAMALISQIRENAKKGDPRARYSFMCLKHYVDTHPNTDFGSENSKSVERELSFWSTVALANGAPIAGNRVLQLAAAFPNPADQETFMQGLTFFRNPGRLQTIAQSLDEPGRRILSMGKALGEARALQAVRRGAPLSALDPMMGWEMGE